MLSEYEKTNDVMKAIRQSNFELMRIVSMVLILVHHFICHGALTSEKNIYGGEAYILIDSFAIIGVNLFLLISGYFGIKLSFRSFFYLVFICFFYKLVHLSADTFLLGISHPVYEWLLKPVFVVSHSGGWFVQVYFMLMFVSPMLNKALENMNKKEWLLSLALLSVIVFYLGWTLHCYNDGAGYTLLNFIFVYFLGATIKRFNLSSRVPAWCLMMMFLVFSFITFIIHFVSKQVALPVAAMAYNSPFVILSACSFFCLFSKLKIQSSVINKIALSVLPVYLLTDGGNLSKVLYNWAVGVSLDFSMGIALLIYLVVAILLILFISIIDQLRLFGYKCLARLFPGYL